MLDGGSYDYVNDTVDSLAIDYVTDYTHAYKMAQRQLRQRQLQPREIKVDVGHEGDYYPLYSTVLLQLPHLLQGLRSSVIKGVQFNAGGAITKIEISDLVEFTPNTRYGIIIQATNNFGHKMFSAEVLNAETSTSTRILTLSEPLSMDNENIIPEMGNHLSFGTLDENGRFSKITNIMKIYGIEPNGKDGFTLTLRDYNPDVYKYTPEGVPIPGYKSNVTRPQKKPNTVTLDDLNELRNQMNKAIDGILINPDEIGNPSIVENLSAVASESGITVKWKSIPSTGLQDAIKHYLIEISKDGGQNWTELTPSATNQFFYTFIRSGEGADGYPEADVFETWRFRVKAENVYGKTSIEWTSTIIDVSEYGTWIPQQPIIATPRISHRIVTLNFSQRQPCYGEIYYLVSIQRYDEYGETIWFKPDLQSDPYSSALAYKDYDATENFVDNGVVYYFLKSANSFTQTLPLEKQIMEGYLEVHKGAGTLEKLFVKKDVGIERELIITRGSDETESVDTNYFYRVWCFNATTGIRSDIFSQVLITAKATSAYDIVDAAIITNKLADGAVTVDKLHANSVTAEKLLSRNLTTVGAFIGSIYGAEIDETEYLLATVYQQGVEYYIYDVIRGVYEKPVIQPTAETFSQGTYYIKNPNYGMPKQTADSFWKGLDTNTPEFRVGNDLNAELFELATGKTNTEAEFMHFLSKNTVYDYSYQDPDTHKDVSGSVTLAKGIYFKIANFIVTAISSVIKGVFYIKNKLTDSNFIEVNPETTATSTNPSIPPERMNIKGDVVIANKSGGGSSGLSVSGGISAGGHLSAASAAISGSQTVGGTLTATGAVSGASFSTNGAINGANLTASGAVSAGNMSTTGSVSASGNISSGGTISGNVVTGNYVRVPVGRPSNPQPGDIWVE